MLCIIVDSCLGKRLIGGELRIEFFCKFSGFVIIGFFLMVFIRVYMEYVFYVVLIVVLYRGIFYVKWMMDMWDFIFMLV